MQDSLLLHVMGFTWRWRLTSEPPSKTQGVSAVGPGSEHRRREMNSSFLCCLLFSAVRRLIQGPEEELGRGGGWRWTAVGCQLKAMSGEVVDGRLAFS